MTHDECHHADFHHVYNSIVSGLYIQNLFQHLKQYITHCLKCLHYQTARHALYKVLQSVVESSISFHTVTTDFILEPAWFFTRRYYR